MRPDYMLRSYLDPILPMPDAKFHPLTALTDRGNAQSIDSSQWLAERLHITETTVFRSREVHEKLSSTTIRVEPVTNGSVVHIEQIEVRSHSMTMFVPHTPAFADTLRQAERRWRRFIDERI